MTLQQRTYFIFFGLSLLIGLPLAIITGQLAFAGVAAMAVAVLIWAFNRVRGANNG